MNINPISQFNKAISVPTDKSILQRALIIGAVGNGLSIESPVLCADSLTTLNCIKAMGTQLEQSGSDIIVRGGALNSGSEYNVNAGNSATAMRLIAGVAAGLRARVTIYGDSSLSLRSMKDTVEALQAMGAQIQSNNYLAPLTITGVGTHGIDFMPVNPSAQVKSAVLLASINSSGTTRIYERIKTRDHTELLLSYLGAEICTIHERNKDFLCISPCKLNNAHIRIPGDMSCAAYSIALALLTNNGQVFIKDVGLNPLRCGMIALLQNAGADIKVDRALSTWANEQHGDITANQSSFKPFLVDKFNLPSMIDEFPILCVLACFARGTSIFTGLTPLKNKESDRAAQMAGYLSAMGADIKYDGERLEITGSRQPFKRSVVVNSLDHRIVMAIAIAGAVGNGCTITDPSVVNVSYPGFFEVLY